MLLFAERCVHGCLGKEKKKTSKTAESIVIPAHADWEFSLDITMCHIAKIFLDLFCNVFSKLHYHVPYVSGHIISFNLHEIYNVLVKFIFRRFVCFKQRTCLSKCQDNFIGVTFMLQEIHGIMIQRNEKLVFLFTSSHFVESRAQ
jgi:hypothetical protein